MAAMHGYDNVCVQPKSHDNYEIKAQLETISGAIEMYPRVPIQEPMVFFNRIRAVTVFFWLTIIIFMMYLPLMDTPNSTNLWVVAFLSVLNLVSFYGVTYKSLTVLGCFYGFEFSLWTVCFVFMSYTAVFYYPSPHHYFYLAWYLVYVCGFNLYRAILVNRIYRYFIECHDEIYLNEIIIEA